MPGAPPWGLGPRCPYGPHRPQSCPWGFGPRCRYDGLFLSPEAPSFSSQLQLKKNRFWGSGRGIVTGLVVPSRARNIGFPLIDANCWGSGRGVVTGLIVPSPLSNIVKPYQQHATCTCFAASRKGSAKRHLPLRLHSSHSSGPTPRLLSFLSAALSSCRAPHVFVSCLGVVLYTCEQTIIFATRASQPSTASAESAKR